MTEDLDAAGRARKTRIHHRRTDGSGARLQKIGVTFMQSFTTRRAVLAVLCALVSIIQLQTVASAHEVTPTTVDVYLGPDDVKAQIAIDTHSSRGRRYRQQWAKGDFPDPVLAINGKPFDVDAIDSASASYEQLKVRLSAQVETDTGPVSIMVSPALGDSIVRVFTRVGGTRLFAGLVPKGKATSLIAVPSVDMQE